jgi:hypothetical protein
MRVQIVPRLFLSSIQDPVRCWIGPVTDRVGRDMDKDLLAMGIRTTGCLIEGGTGECHAGHLKRFEQGGLLIPFGSNGEFELLTRNRQDLTQRYTNGVAVEGDTPLCGCGSIDSFFRSRSGSSGRQLLVQVFTVLGEFARDTSGAVAAVHTRGNERCDCVVVVILNGYPGSDSSQYTDLLVEVSTTRNALIASSIVILLCCL